MNSIGNILCVFIKASSSEQSTEASSHDRPKNRFAMQNKIILCQTHNRYTLNKYILNKPKQSFKITQLTN